MKKNQQNENHPLRVCAETLRHLGRPKLAAVGGGLTTMTNAAADCSTDGWTNVDRPPTGTTAI